MQTSAPVFEHGAGFVRQHRRGDVGILDGECAAEAAALVDGRQIDELNAAHIPQQPKGNVAQVQAAQGMAAGVVGHAMRISGASVFHAKLVHQKFGELVDARQQLFDIGR